MAQGAQLNTLKWPKWERKSEKKIALCVCITHFAVHLKLTQYCKSTIIQNKFKLKNS